MQLRRGDRESFLCSFIPPPFRQLSTYTHSVPGPRRTQ